MNRITPAKDNLDCIDHSSSRQEGAGFTNRRDSVMEGDLTAKTGMMNAFPVKGQHANSVCDAFRKRETAERLGRLRTELAKISPFPETALQARTAIVMAMARANLGDWTIPELDDPSAVSCRDGSVKIALIAHEITFNPWGAFRINDLRARFGVYFELTGANQRVFIDPGSGN